MIVRLVTSYRTLKSYVRSADMLVITKNTVTEWRAVTYWILQILLVTAYITDICKRSIRREVLELL